MGLNAYMKGNYEEFHALKATKNKANIWFIVRGS
jgi:hypothetical protein